MTTGAAKPRIDIMDRIAAGGAAAPAAGVDQRVAATAGGRTANTNQIGSVNGDVEINNTYVEAPAGPAIERIWLQREATGLGAPVATVAPGDRLYLRYTLSRAALAQRLRLNLDGPLPAMIRLQDAETGQPFDPSSMPVLWTGELKAAGDAIGDEAPFAVELPDPLPIGQARLCLALISQNNKDAYIEPDVLELKGNFVPPGPLLELLQIESPEPLPEAAACLHIYPYVPPTPAPDAKPLFNLSCFLGSGARYEEREQPLGALPACLLADEPAASLFVKGVNDLSQQRQALIERLKLGYDGVLVFDYAGTGAPWEGLDFGQRAFLSATLPTGRWLRLAPERRMKYRPEPVAGAVLALGDLPGAPAAWQVQKVATVLDLWDAFWSKPYSLVYVGDAPDVASLEVELANAIDYQPLAGPRPLFILGYQQAAEVTYRDRVAQGTAATLLRDVADGVVGVGGRGDQAALDGLIAATVGHLAAGAPIGEALRLARKDVVDAWRQRQASRLALATALLLHYYGSPALRLVAPQGDGGGS